MEAGTARQLSRPISCFLFLSPRRGVNVVRRTTGRVIMKTMSKLSVVILLLSMATAAWAVCPNAVGTFSYLNGTLLGGRVSEAWCNGAAGQPGNTEDACLLYTSPSPRD